MRRIAPVAATFLVLIASCAQRAPGEDRFPSTTGQPWTSLAEGWTELPYPPAVGDGAAWVSTGSELLVWGGCDPTVENDRVPSPEGYVFDPFTLQWHPLLDAPLPGADPEGTWTGEEAIFLNVAAESRLEGQAFDPKARDWRRIPAAPIEPRHDGVLVWTGSELIVWGGGGPNDPRARMGAAYNPATDSWRQISDSPLGLNLASGMWTGREMLVFGSLLDGRNIAETSTSVGAAYDPAADTWRRIPPSSLSPQATSAVWVDGRMVAWDYAVHSQEYDPASNAWSPPIQMPLDAGECYPDSITVRGLVFAFFCGHAALYDAATGQWQEIGGGPLEFEIRAHGSPYKLWRFASLVSAGDVVVLPMQGLTVDEKETPCYGCPGSPVSFWAYRPPSA